MVVIVVMTILAGVLIPDFSGDRDEAKLRTAGRTLLSTLRFAASHAATMNRAHRLQIDPPTRRFWLEVQDDKREFRPVADMMHEFDASLRIDFRRPEPKLLNREATSEPPPEPVTEEEVRMFGGFVNNELQRIYFWPDGTADAREILVQAEDEGGIVLSINPTTSRVSFLRVGPDGRPIGALPGGNPAQPEAESASEADAETEAP